MGTLPVELLGQLLDFLFPGDPASGPFGAGVEGNVLGGCQISVLLGGDGLAVALGQGVHNEPRLGGLHVHPSFLGGRVGQGMGLPEYFIIEQHRLLLDGLGDEERFLASAHHAGIADLKNPDLPGPIGGATRIEAFDELVNILRPGGLGFIVGFLIEQLVDEVLPLHACSFI